MAGAAQAPTGAAWRPSALAHLRRVQVLERDSGEHVGSVGPAPGGRWMNRDTGATFDSITLAKSDVEKYL